jgi:hypothetical protein
MGGNLVAELFAGKRLTQQLLNEDRDDFVFHVLVHFTYEVTKRQDIFKI